LRHSLKVLFPTVSSVFIATKLFHQMFSEKRKRKASHPSNATQRNATQRNATQRHATPRHATQRNATQRKEF